MRVEPRLPRTRPHDLPSKLILRFIFWELLSPCYFFLFTYFKRKPFGFLVSELQNGGKIRAGVRYTYSTWCTCREQPTPGSREETERQRERKERGE